MPTSSPYRTAPLPSTDMPKGIPYIIGNEAAERYSFYGMRSILVVFMTEHLMNADGELAVMTEENARAYYHLFTFGAYFFPFFGALLSDVFLGKFRTIMLLSIVYCFGHGVLAIDDTRFGLAIGLALISIGAGGIKPCVSAHVGDQFSKANEPLISRVFAWFYFSINVGSAAASFISPLLLHRFGPGVAFGVPGVLMAIATLCFWLGRHKFVHIPPGGMGFLRDVFSREGILTLARLCILYVFIAVFWSLYDQTGSAWVLQAKHMNLSVLGYELQPSQVQALNPVMILIFIPLFAYGLYPAVNRFIPVTPLRKISFGLFVMAAAFAVPGWIETRIAAGETPSIAWHVLAYALLTASEVMVSITGIEYSYTQAPKKMKSFVMALFFLAISMGNLFTSAVNFFIQNPDGTVKLDGPSYYWFFTILMAIAATIFIVVAMKFRERTYLQDATEA